MFLPKSRDIQDKMPSPKVIGNAFWLVTVKVLNSYSKNTEWDASRFPGGIPLVGLWRRVHEFSGNVTTAYRRVRTDTADLLSDIVIFSATWYGGIFRTCKQVQTIELDR